MASRLGRAFVPLAGLFLAGVVGVVGGTVEGWWTALGAPLSAGALLAYGLATVQQTMGRPRRSWMSAASVASVVPAAYGVYVLGWRGLRGLTTSEGALAILAAILYVILGVWVLRAWLRVLEVQRLAHVMASDIDGDGESA